MSWARITSEAIDMAAVSARVASPSHGGTVIFSGTVRDHADGRPVTGIEYEAYTEMASKELKSIADDCESAHDGVSVAVEHRLGELTVSDVAVVIAAAHAHRAVAFDACRYVIEQIKVRLPVWKREHYADGTSEWVAPAGAVTLASPER